jgi:hypothetical protein
VLMATFRPTERLMASVFCLRRAVLPLGDDSCTHE